MGLYKKYEEHVINKTIKGYESIIRNINMHYSDMLKVIDGDLNFNSQIDSCIRRGEEAFDEYLGEYKNSSFVDQGFISLMSSINNYSKRQKDFDRCYSLIDEMIRNSNIENKEQLLKKDWTNKLESLYAMSNKSGHTNYDNTYLFIVGSAFIPEYMKLLMEIKPLVDAKKNEGFTLLDAIKYALDEKNIKINDSKILSTLYTKRNKHLTDNNRLREEYKDRYIKNYFIKETNGLKQQYRQKLNNGVSKEEILKEILPYAYALVKAACKYSKGMEAYDVQLMGAIALNEGNVASMYTGEGKSLTAIFAAYLNALTGEEVDIFTPNDYLSKRDSESAREVLNLLGMNVGCVLVNEQSTLEKQNAYKCDIVYGSSTAFAFDYLKDTTANPENIVSRLEKPGFVIVDEADQILINNALNPYQLTTSNSNLTKQDRIDNKNAKRYIELALEIEKMLSKSRYVSKSQYEYECITGENKEYTPIMNEKFSLLIGTNDVYLTEKGEKELFYYLMYDAALDLVRKSCDYFKGNPLYELGVDYLYRKDELVLTVSGFDKACTDLEDFRELNKKWLTDPNLQSIRKYLSNALTARYITKQGMDYQVMEDVDGSRKIVLLQDGRIMPDSKFTEGLHEAIEIKEGIEINLDKGNNLIDSSLASISNRALLYRYGKVSGMTGTPSKDVFKEIYNLNTIDIPRNQNYLYDKGKRLVAPFKRKDRPIVLCSTDSKKIELMVTESVNSYLKGQPVLLVGDNEEVVKKVHGTFVKITPKLGAKLLLSNKNLEEEAEIISKAGMKSSITVASEMAGRGTDIKLGGKDIDIEKIKHNIFMQEAQDYINESGIKKSSDVLDRIIESIKLKYKESKIHRELVDRKVEEEIQNIKEQIYSSGGLRYIQMNPFRTSRNDNQGRGRVNRQGEPGETITYASIQDLANIGVSKQNLDALSNMLVSREYIDDKEAKGLISESILSAQEENEYNDNLTIASTDSMDLAMSSIGGRILEKRAEIIRSESESNYMNSSIDALVSQVIKENVPINKTGVASKDKYRISKLKLNSTDFASSVREVFGVEISEEAILDNCVDVYDLKCFVEDKVSTKLKEIVRTSPKGEFTRKTKKKFLDHINQVYSDFLYSSKAVELQRFNDSLAQNTSHNRFKTLEEIYNECYADSLKKTLKNIFRPNMTAKSYEEENIKKY